MSFLLWVSHWHAAHLHKYYELQADFQVGHLDTKTLFCLHSSMSTVFSQPELCCYTSQLVAYICLLQPAGIPTFPHVADCIRVPLQLTEHATASTETVATASAFSCTLCTAFCAANYECCSNYVQWSTSHTPHCSTNRQRFITAQHETASEKKTKKAEIPSGFSLTSNLITPRFPCTSFHVHQCCFFCPETRVLLQPVWRRSPWHMFAAADREPDCSYSYLAPVKFTWRGLISRLNCSRILLSKALPLPTGSRIYLSRYLLTNNPDPCQKSSAALIVHINKNWQ